MDEICSVTAELAHENVDVLAVMDARRITCFRLAMFIGRCQLHRLETVTKDAELGSDFIEVDIIRHAGTILKGILKGSVTNEN